MASFNTIVLAHAFLFLTVQSLSIPPTPKVDVVRNESVDFVDITTAEPETSTFLEIDVISFGDIDSPENNTESNEQSSQSKESNIEITKRQVATEENPQESTPLPGVTSTDDTYNIETSTVNSDLSGGDNTNDATLSGRKPVMEVVDIIFRPFQPPSVVVLDFFRKPNNTQEKRTGSVESDEDISGTIAPSGESNNEPTSESSSVGAHSGERRDIKLDTQDWREGNSRNNAFLRTSKLSQQGQTESGNEDSSSVSDEDKERDSLFTTKAPTSTTLHSSSADSSRRRRRETHQMSNNSTEGDDNSDASGESQSTTSPPFSIHETLGKLAEKFQGAVDDMMMTPRNKTDGHNDEDKTSNVDSDDATDEDNNGTSPSKSGTVKIFLEILQLVPISNNSSDDSSPSGNEDSTTASPSPSTETAREAAESGESGTKTVIHSLKANSNQKISTANSTRMSAQTEDETHEVGTKKRVVRCVSAGSSKGTTTGQPAAEGVAAAAAEKEQGNPSTSPAASASPSSGMSNKPLTGKDAPAAPAPSANARAAAQ